MGVFFPAAAVNLSLTSGAAFDIINIEKALPNNGSARMFLKDIRNRHLAEWRFPLFTVIVTVHPKM